MARLLPSTFSRYHLDEAETQQGTLLNEYQKMMIQNEIALVAERKLALLFTDTQEFIQNEARYGGQIEILKYLLDASEVEENRIKETAELNGITITTQNPQY